MLRVEFRHDFDLVEQKHIYSASFCDVNGRLFTANEDSLTKLLKGLRNILAVQFVMESASDTNAVS